MSRIADVFEIRDGIEGNGDALRVAFVVAILLSLFLLGGWIGKSNERNVWRQDSVELGYAEYSQETGRWQWKGHK
jgi:hypothetical protein